MYNTVYNCTAWPNIRVSSILQAQSTSLHFDNFFHDQYHAKILLDLPEKCLPTYLPTYPPVYGSTALYWALFVLSVSWSFTQSVGHLGRGISPSQGRYLHTGQHKHRTNAHRHSCLQWDSNPRFQCMSRRTQFMPQAARPLWPAEKIYIYP
jgi:hypothetical protein